MYRISGRIIHGYWYPYRFHVRLQAEQGMHRISGRINRPFFIPGIRPDTKFDFPYIKNDRIYGQLVSVTIIIKTWKKINPNLFYFMHGKKMLCWKFEWKKNCLWFLFCYFLYIWRHLMPSQRSGRIFGQISGTGIRSHRISLSYLASRFTGYTAKSVSGAYPRQNSVCADLG
jgi:hypothetical protein